MKKIFIIITIITLVFLLFLKCTNLKEIPHKQLIKDYSDVPLAKYTLHEWEDLGVDIWKKYYSPERWKALKAKSSWIDNYELGRKDDLDFVLKTNQKKGLVIDKTNIEIWARPLYEEILPIKRWFWGYDKIRIFTCEYTIVYNGEKLRTYSPSLPPTEGNAEQK